MPNPLAGIQRGHTLNAPTTFLPPADRRASRGARRFRSAGWRDRSSCPGGRRHRGARPQLRLRSCNDGEPALHADLRAANAGAGLRLVQFFGPTQDAWLAGLEASGLKVLQYYPHYTYLVWGTAASAEAAQSLDFVRWTGAFHPAYKINSDLQGREGLVENVDVIFYNDGDVDATVKALEALGAKVIDVHPSQPDKAFFDAIVVLDAEPAPPTSPAWTRCSGWATAILCPCSTTRCQARSSPATTRGAGVPFTGYQAWLTALGYDGTGVRWATIDTGVDYDHPDLGSHIVAGYSFPGTCVSPAQPARTAQAAATAPTSPASSAATPPALSPTPTASSTAWASP